MSFTLSDVVTQLKILVKVHHCTVILIRQSAAWLHCYPFHAVARETQTSCWPQRKLAFACSARQSTVITLIETVNAHYLSSTSRLIIRVIVKFIIMLSFCVADVSYCFFHIPGSVNTARTPGDQNHQISHEILQCTLPVNNTSLQQCPGRFLFSAMTDCKLQNVGGR